MRCAGIHRDLTELRDAIAATAVPFEGVRPEANV
jgi:hypothetical protein